MIVKRLKEAMRLTIIFQGPPSRISILLALLFQKTCGIPKSLFTWHCQELRPIRVWQLRWFSKATNSFHSSKRVHGKSPSAGLDTVLTVDHQNDPNGMFLDADGLYHLYYQCEHSLHDSDLGHDLQGSQTIQIEPGPVTNTGAMPRPEISTHGRINP